MELKDITSINTLKFLLEMLKSILDPAKKWDNSDKSTKRKKN